MVKHPPRILPRQAVSGLLRHRQPDVAHLLAVAERLNVLQFLTIRGYLTMVFGALVGLLLVLTLWQ